MKRIFSALFITVLASLTIAAETKAESTYTVEIGECLSAIGAKLKVSWREIARTNGIKSPYVIRYGQRLIISGRKKAKVAKVIRPHSLPEIGGDRKGYHVYRHLNRDPFRGNSRATLLKAGYTSTEVKEIIQRLQMEKGELVRIHKGEILSWVSFGKNRIWKGSVLIDWQEDEWTYAGKYCASDGKCALRIVDCLNWAGLPETLAPKRVPSRAVRSPMLPIAPGVPTTPCAKSRDNWDWYVGGGNYYSAHQGGDNNGYYGWTKARYRPTWCDLGPNVSIGVGAVGFLAGGKGIASKHYDYNWSEATIGVTAKLLVPHRDFDLDLMGGGLWNSGKWQGQKVNDQYDAIFLGALHGNFYERRDAGEKWFPKAEFNVEGRLPISTKVKMGEKTNNSYVDLTFTQFFYDFGSKAFMVSPGVNLGGGWEASSPKDPYFGQFGPRVEVSSYDNVIVGLDIFNYKTNNGGQWHPIGAFISVDGLCDAWKAAHITEVTPPPIPASGSRLLANPADYLK